MPSPALAPSPSPDFLPTATLDMLRRRAELLRTVRRFFDDRGFLEVETPLLSHDTVVDRHLDPIPVTFFKEPRQHERGERMWLQTSPEFAMKRLLAGGMTAIYQVAKAFRGGRETGPEHNPEFTIVEWYRVGDDYAAGMQLLSDLAETVFGAGPAERVTYREAFQRYVGFDPFAPAVPPWPGLQETDHNLNLDVWLTSKIEPNLGREKPTILHDYPASQAALARVRPGDPPVAERFELYFRGLELANGYHELLDPAVLRERNRANNTERFADDKYLLPEESRLLAAMEHGLPACSGCALGFDRLVMAATGAKRIEEVLAFSIERA
jgi:elongation factor P--(R)-beta-lysine ligase